VQSEIELKTQRKQRVFRPLEVRDEVYREVVSGKTFSQVARERGIPLSTVKTWSRRQQWAVAALFPPGLRATTRRLERIDKDLASTQLLSSLNENLNADTRLKVAKLLHETVRVFEEMSIDELLQNTRRLKRFVDLAAKFFGW
jgi:hypothetical protein